MIAFAGAMRLAERQAVGAFNVKPRWPLSDIVKQADVLDCFEAMKGRLK